MVVAHGQVHLVDPPLQADNLLLVFPVPVEEGGDEEAQQHDASQHPRDQLLVLLSGVTLTSVITTVRFVPDVEADCGGIQGAVL